MNNAQQTTALVASPNLRSGVRIALIGLSLLCPYAVEADDNDGVVRRHPEWRINAGFGRVSLPTVGGGTVIDGTDEIALGHSESTLSTTGYGLDLFWMSDAELLDTIDSLESLARGSYDSVGSVAPSIDDSLESLYDEDDLRDEESWGPPTRLGWSFHIAKFTGDGETITGEPIGGRNVANTYFSHNPNGGSTGVALGALGEDVRIRTDYDDLKFRVGYVQQRGQNSGGFVRSGPRLTLEKIDVMHDIMLTSPSIPSPSDFSSRAKYDISENRIGLGYEILRNYKATDHLSFAFGAGFDLLYRDVKLDATQDNLCGLCGGTETSVSFSEKRDDSGGAFNVDLTVGARYAFTDSTRLGLTLGGSYTSKIAKVDAKDNPSDSLDLKSESFSERYLQLVLSTDW